MKSNPKEVIEYYNKFYSEDDFKYYPYEISKKFLEVIIRKCKLNKGAKILDLGCGTGYYTHLFMELGFDSLGVDLSKTAIEKARVKYSKSKFEIQDAMNLTYSKNEFDMIFLFGCSVVNRENIEEIDQYFNYIIQFIKKNGYLVYIGGSNLSKSYIGESEWYNHSWKEISTLGKTIEANIEGPFLTHIKLLKYLGAAGFSIIFNKIFSLKIFKFKRMIVEFINVK